MIEQDFQSVVNRVRNNLTVRLLENQKMNIEVRGIAMVVTGLLKVDAVGAHVNWKLLQQNLLTSLPPTLCIFEFGQQYAEVKKTECLASQVCIRAEVGGEVGFQMPGVQIQKLQGSNKCP